MFNKKEYNKRYKEEHREYFNQKRKEYYLRNREQELKKRSEYYFANKEKRAEYRKEYYKNYGKDILKGDQLEYFKSIVSGHFYKEIQDMFYEKYGVKLSKNKIVSINKYYGLKTNAKKEKTPEHFKNYIQENKRDLFEERIHKGLIEIKIKQPDVWMQKHKYIWEKKNGKVPKDKVLIFKDGNKLNCKLKNLMLVNKSDMIVMNSKGLKVDCGEEILKTNILLSQLFRKKNKIKKQL